MNRRLYLFIILVIALTALPWLSRATEGFTTTSGTTARGGSYGAVTTDAGNTYAVGQTAGGQTATASSANGVSTTTSGNYNYVHGQGTNFPVIWYSPDGTKTARVIKTPSSDTIVITNNVDGSTEVFYLDTSQPNVYVSKVGNKIVIVTTTTTPTFTVTYTTGAVIVYTTEPVVQPIDVPPTADEVNNYNSSYGSVTTVQGGAVDMNLYMLKTECTQNRTPVIIYRDNPNTEVPPCPACKRCEMPPMECKLQPNYAAISANHQPQFVPQVSEYSTFGM